MIDERRHAANVAYLKSYGRRVTEPSMQDAGRVELWRQQVDDRATQLCEAIIAEEEAAERTEARWAEWIAKQILNPYPRIRKTA